MGRITIVDWQLSNITDVTEYDLSYKLTLIKNGIDLPEGFVIQWTLNAIVKNEELFHCVAKVVWQMNLEMLTDEILAELINQSFLDAQKELNPQLASAHLPALSTVHQSKRVAARLLHELRQK